MPFRFIRTDVARNIEDNLVILAIPLGWLHLLLYFRVLKITGPFVVMIYKMIVGDILTFCTIYIVLLVGFSTGK
jgi:transient receptor potential cation channel subfamily V protein 6